MGKAISGSDDQATTDADGEAWFRHLKPLTEKQSYVLVETKAADGYWAPEHYSEARADTQHGMQTAEVDRVYSVDGISDDYVKYTVLTYEQQQEAIEAKDPLEEIGVEAYNMPQSHVIVLKYDNDHPERYIPENANFQLKGHDPDTPSAFIGEVYTNDITVNTSAKSKSFLADWEDGHTVTADGVTYTYHIQNGNYWFSDGDGNLYSFDATEAPLWPDTYTLTETKVAQNAYDTTTNEIDTEHLYMDTTKDTDTSAAWYYQQSVKVEDDGEIYVLKLSNVPAPNANIVSILKEVKTVEDLSGDGVLDRMQDGWQYVTYNISEFAPGKDKVTGEVPAYVEYGMSKLYLDDNGLTFYYINKGGAETLAETGEQYVTTVTIGKANYETAKSSVPVAVYGASGSMSSPTYTYLTTVDVANGPATVGDDYFTENKYWGFQLRYDCTESTQNQMPEHFKAEAVQVTYAMKQQDQKQVAAADQEDLISKVVNTTTVTMGYAVGTDSVYSVSDVATVPADNVEVLPVGKLVKGVYIYDTDDTLAADAPMHTGMTDVTGLQPGQMVKYVLTFTNTKDDSELSIPDPFVVDVMPSVMDLYDTDGSLLGVSASTTSSTVKLDDCEIGSNGVVSVKGTGELQQGESVTLTIIAKLKDTAMMATDDIINKAYAGSTTITEKNTQNPNGTPFRSDEEGNWPTHQVSDYTPDQTKDYEGSVLPAYEDYYVLKDELQHRIEYSNDITIAKAVSADMTGMDEL